MYEVDRPINGIDDESRGIGQWAIGVIGFLAVESRIYKISDPKSERIEASNWHRYALVVRVLLLQRG